MEAVEGGAPINFQRAFFSLPQFELQAAMGCVDENLDS